MTKEGTKTATGKCLCGAVTFTAYGMPDKASACHCDMCRRWASGPMLAVHPDKITIDHPERVGWYRSSEWAERGFCKTCGGAMFFRIVATGDLVAGAGTFDDPTLIHGMREHIFIDEKPDYYDFKDNALRKTGPEFIAEILEAQAAAEGDPDAAP